MNVLLIDGHPASGRLSAHLLDRYAAGCPESAAIERINIRDLTFDPILRHGYAQPQPWEPDLTEAARKIDRADHLVFAFPMWWGGEPALLKGFIDRLFQPHFAFAYRDKGPWWDKLMAGRSADALITLDTPPWYLRFVYGNAIVHQWRKQVLEYCGFKPVRLCLCGPVRDGNAEKQMGKWLARVDRLARSWTSHNRTTKVSTLDAYLDYRAKSADAQP